MLGSHRDSKCPVGQSRVSEEQGFPVHSKHTGSILKRRLSCVCRGQGEAKQKCRVGLCTGWLTDWGKFRRLTMGRSWGYLGK